jgi:hypothetical protein
MPFLLNLVPFITDAASLVRDGFSVDELGEHIKNTDGRLLVGESVISLCVVKTGIDGLKIVGVVLKNAGRNLGKRMRRGVRSTERWLVAFDNAKRPVSRRLPMMCRSCPYKPHHPRRERPHASRMPTKCRADPRRPPSPDPPTGNQ